MRAVAHLSAGAAEHHVITTARERSTVLYGMTTRTPTRASRVAPPTQLVPGFGNVGEQAVTDGIATSGHLLTGRLYSAGP
ncbi:hypothetical protein ACWDSL_27825 [Streptomyces sp. NPDC000941]